MALNGEGWVYFVFGVTGNCSDNSKLEWWSDPFFNFFVFQVASETFERARILIAPQNDAWGDVPYTKQPGLCGDEGDYIHLTPGFLVNSTTIATFNNRGKSFKCHLWWAQSWSTTRQSLIQLTVIWSYSPLGWWLTIRMGATPTAGSNLILRHDIQKTVIYFMSFFGLVSLQIRH